MPGSSTAQGLVAALKKAETDRGSSGARKSWCREREQGAPLGCVGKAGGRELPVHLARRAFALEGLLIGRELVGFEQRASAVLLRRTTLGESPSSQRPPAEDWMPMQSLMMLVFVLAAVLSVGPCVMLVAGFPPIRTLLGRAHSRAPTSTLRLSAIQDNHHPKKKDDHVPAPARGNSDDVLMKILAQLTDVKTQMAANKESSDQNFLGLKTDMADVKTQMAANKESSDTQMAANKESSDQNFLGVKTQMAANKESSDTQFAGLTFYNAKRDRELEQLAVSKFVEELEIAGWTVREIHVSDIKNDDGKKVLEWDGYLLGTKSDAAKLFIFETKQVFDKQLYDKFLVRLAKMKTSVLPEILQGSGGQFQKNTKIVQGFQTVLGLKDKFQVVGVLCSPSFRKEVTELIETSVVGISVVKMATEKFQVTIRV